MEKTREELFKEARIQLDQAIENYLALSEEKEGWLVQDWVLVSYMTTFNSEDEHSRKMSCDTRTGQSRHATIGLLEMASDYTRRRR